MLIEGLNGQTHEVTTSWMTASGSWPWGTEGTVLELFGSEAALVEISDDRGHTLEELELPIGTLRIVGRPPQQQLPVG